MEKSTDLLEKYSQKPGNYYGFPRNEMVEFIPQSAKKILDVGCSNGAFGKNVKSKRPGTVVWGIEPFEEAAIAAKSGLDNVIIGLFNNRTPELKDEKFDCIVFNDVLEHMIEPDKALGDCKKYLNENGFIVASIPNILFFPVMFYQILYREDWKYEKSGTLDNTHLRFFTKKSIIRMFENAGFEVVTIKGINPCPGRVYSLLNLMLLNRLKDWRYAQFAITARLRP